MIFVDTWAWIALADRSDEYHVAAKTQHKKFQRNHRRYVTTDFVVSETITYLFDALPFSHAHAFAQSIFNAADLDAIQFTHVSPEQFRRAWTMRQKYQDKPDISFVDFTSMVVMQDLGLTDIFTGDNHFRQVDLGFHLYP